MLVYLLTRKPNYLHSIRQLIESLNMTLINCSTLNMLLMTCSRGPGSIFVPAMEFSVSEVEQIIRKLRSVGFPHPVLVVDLKPTAISALEWSKIPISDYFDLNTSPYAVKTILENAQNWLQTQGKRDVLQSRLEQRWESLDPKLKDVMRLLYDGLSNQEIALKLSISSRTVENRRARLFKNFEVNSLAELIRIATGFMEGDVLPESLLKHTV